MTKLRTLHDGKKLKGWDALIIEAKDRIKELQQAVEHFERNKARGEPFFGESVVGRADKHAMAGHGGGKLKINGNEINEHLRANRTKGDCSCVGGVRRSRRRWG